MIVNYALSLLHLVNCAPSAPGNAEIISVLGGSLVRCDGLAASGFRAVAVQVGDASLAMADILKQDGRDTRQAAVSADRAELSAAEPRCSAPEFRYPLRSASGNHHGIPETVPQLHTPCPLPRVEEKEHCCCKAASSSSPSGPN
jgi:hypothetical protein